MVSGTYIWIGWPAVAALVFLWQRRRGAEWSQMLAALALAAYGWWICSVAFFPIPRAETVSALRAAAGEDGPIWVNLVPIRALIDVVPTLSAGQIVRQFGGNILLFVPFTMLAPLYWRRLRTWVWPLAVGLGGSVAIEVVQLVLSGVVGYPYRQTDVDDVILNAFGAFLGFAALVYSTHHGHPPIRQGRHSTRG
jgi:glycopeptide antibiotics resistance protein